MQTTTQSQAVETGHRQTGVLSNAPAPLATVGVTVYRGGIRVLDQVTFTAGPNCLMGVVGPNGVGKSTLFNAIVGLLQVDEDQVLIHGSPVDEARGLIAYVPQHENVKGTWRIRQSTVRFSHGLETGPVTPPHPSGSGTHLHAERGHRGDDRTAHRSD